MRTTKFSWTFPLLFIIVFLGIYLALQYYKEGMTSAPPQNSSVVKSIAYTLAGVPYNMTAPSRVWRDPHGEVVWLWEEVPPKLIQLKAISDGHVGQTLTLDLDKNKYIWDSLPPNGVQVGEIGNTSTTMPPSQITPTS